MMMILCKFGSGVMGRKRSILYEPFWETGA